MLEYIKDYKAKIEKSSAILAKLACDTKIVIRINSKDMVYTVSLF